MSKQLNKYSSSITQPKSQGGSQAMLHGTGLTADDMQKPQVGIASMWYEGNTCNMHLNDLSAQVKKGVEEAGLVGMRFNTIGVSDGISMGTDGMSYSLQSREIIADSIETTMSAHWYDANISVPGCDKNMPGCVMAMGRLNRPSLMVYGGTIRAGCTAQHDKLDIVSAFQSYGEYLAGSIDEQERQDIVRHSCPGPGACGGMYTANTMASAIEALGMSLPYSSSNPAESQEKRDECLHAGQAIQILLERDIKPRDIMTREAFENAITVIMALGGSTNAVLHLVAMARAVDVDLTIDDFQTISDRVPYLADLKPSGQFVMEDVYTIGGIPAVMKMLLKAGLLNGDCLTVTGKTVAENLAGAPGLMEGQTIVRPLDNPIKETGHLQILRGNLAPEGAVAKITGKEGERFSGRANVFDAEEEMLAALERDEIKKGDVIIIRYEGPKGGPGMPEMLTPTSAIMGAG
ncbi:MAG: dihydroxy-acid dehydratase, partial [Anaerolineaceae bacterium]